MTLQVAAIFSWYLLLDKIMGILLVRCSTYCCSAYLVLWRLCTVVINLPYCYYAHALIWDEYIDMSPF